MILQTVLGNTTIEIYNSIGQLMLRKRIESNNSVIDIEKFSDGIYQIVITVNTESTFTKKIIKE